MGVGSSVRRLELSACRSGAVLDFGRPTADAVDVDVGIGFTPFETRSDLMVRLAVQAEELGFDHVAVPEGHPVDRLRGTVTTVRALLAGERLPDVPPGARALRLGVLPDSPVRIEMAALASSAIRLAGELADGWVPFLWARSRIDAGRQLLADGERRSEAPTPTRVAPCVPVALGPDEASARQLAVWWISTYMTRMGPLYPRLLREPLGMASGVDAVLEAAAAGDEGKLPAHAEALADEVALFGTYDRAADAIASWSAAGADSLHLTLPPGRPEEELAEILRVTAGARRGVAATSG